MRVSNIIDLRISDHYQYVVIVTVTVMYATINLLNMKYNLLTSNSYGTRKLKIVTANATLLLVKIVHLGSDNKLCSYISDSVLQALSADVGLLM